MTDVDGSAPRAITEEGIVTAAPPSPDDQQLAVYNQNGGVSLLRLDGGATSPLPGLSPHDLPIQWTADGRGLFVRRIQPRRQAAQEPLFANGYLETAPPVEILKYDLDAGTLSPWQTIEGPDGSQFGHIDNVLITRDGASWAYGDWLRTGDLYVIEGLK